MSDQTTSRTRTEGWPADHGPLHILCQLGLHNDPNQRPNWLHYPRTETYAGIETHHATTKFLSNDSLRSLAALTLEGWQVFIDPADRGLRIKVSHEKQTP